MFNTIVPKEEVESIQKVIDQFKEYTNKHEMIAPNMKSMDNKLHVIHTIMYLETLRDIAKSLCIMESLLEIPEEEFLSTITDDGKHTVEEVYRRLIFESAMSMAADM